MGTLGNTFDNKSVKYGHARKVWREIRHVYPGGGKITNVSDFSEAGVIPAGTPAKIDMEKHEITVFTKAQVAAAKENMSTLGINGFLQEDNPLTDNKTVATNTVVYAGEIYEYMFDYDADVLEKLKALPAISQVMFVR